MTVTMPQNYNTNSVSTDLGFFKGWCILLCLAQTLDEGHRFTL